MYVLLFKSYWSLFQGSNWQYVIIASSNDPVPNKRQTITWTKYEQDRWHLMASLGHSNLTHLLIVPHIALVNRVSIGSDNGSPPIGRQAII